MKPRNRIHEITSELLNSDYFHETENMILHIRITGIIKYLDEQYEKENHDQA